MNALLPFVILGITAGSVYGLTGTGLRPAGLQPGVRDPVGGVR